MITFHTTTDAMAMERYCKKKEPGRLIPVPGTISAGCGLAWCVLPQREGTSFESDGGGGYNSAGCA